MDYSNIHFPVWLSPGVSERQAAAMQNMAPLPWPMIAILKVEKREVPSGE